jgi:predicted adenine nucleotide alpha hydrolase (AANH) superfamily ATPase
MMTAKKAILVHACCASCSSYVLEHLAETYEVAAYFFNPNIHPDEEYGLRLAEMRSVCGGLGLRLFEGDSPKELWRQAVLPYRDLPEKSERCWTCYRFRLEETARMAAESLIPLFTTTLSVSPHKSYERVAAIGVEAAAKHGVEFLAEDFKKKDGFKICVARSRERGLTRQDYCGCLMSLEEAQKRRDAGKA